MRVTVETSDLRGTTSWIEADIAEAETLAMGDVAQELKAAWRAEIMGAGLGQRVANSIRAKVFPDNAFSLDPAAWVESRAARIMDAFDRGVTIRSRTGRWLAIPAPAAGSKRISPAQWEQRTGLKLRFVPLRSSRSALLVADNARLSGRGLARRNTDTNRASGAQFTRLQGRATVIVFTLQRTVTLGKRIDLDGLANHAAASFDGFLSIRWSQLRVDRAAPLLMDDNGRRIAAPPPSRFKGVKW